MISQVIFISGIDIFQKGLGLSLLQIMVGLFQIVLRRD